MNAEAKQPLANLIAADRAHWDAMSDADERGEAYELLPSPMQELIMAYDCGTLSDIRAKLAWMTECGTGLVGEEYAFPAMLLTLDRLIAADR